MTTTRQRQATRLPRRKPAAKRAQPLANNSIEHDRRAAQKLVIEMMAIPGRSGQERQVREFIIDRLRRAGAPSSAIRGDQAHRHTPLRGEVGNLFFRMHGTVKALRRLLVAHMDTVPLCVGSKPTVKGSVVRSAATGTGLGADDRAGCAVLLTAALEITRRKLPHPPLTFLWNVQEEVGLFGARFVNLALLAGTKLAFNFDGGSADKLTIGATGAFRVRIVVKGLASHAGNSPEHGVSAIAIAALAIADLQRNGWLGDVRRGERRGTSNVGVITGGAATNVVTDHVELKAEARSHDPEFRQQILDAMEQAFRHAAGEVRSASGTTGEIEFESRTDYEAFRLPDHEPCVIAAERAILAAGGKPIRAVTNGGLDANWLTARGIPTVTLGCGQQNPHTASERLDLDAFHQACRVALRLATATE